MFERTILALVGLLLGGVILSAMFNECRDGTRKHEIMLRCIEKHSVQECQETLSSSVKVEWSSKPEKKDGD